MNIEDKYGIITIRKKRYYNINMSDYMLLDETIPYCFIYKEIRIFSGSWNRVTVKILEEIDKLKPKSTEELLHLQYSWSKQPVFSTDKRINFTHFKGIYLNTNHTSTHARMNIQCILKTYGINLNECSMIIRRHPKAEPAEVREHYKRNTIAAFSNYLILKVKTRDKIETVINNINTINKFLTNISSGYDDFFLFDDFYYFCNYKKKTIDYVSKKYPLSNNLNITIRMLEYLDEFYRLRGFFEDHSMVSFAFTLKKTIYEEIIFLFDRLNSNVINSSKLYSRIMMIYPDVLLKLREFNNQNDFYHITKIMLNKSFVFKDPFIAKDDSIELSNEQIILNYTYSLSSFTIKMINNYIEKMHLKKPDSYLNLLKDCSEDYVQVDIDQMVRKEVIDITNDSINKIDYEISFYIKSFGNIDAEKYNDYGNLPSLDYEWNRYLLIGIVRSYLSNKYHIQYTSNSYLKTNFIIIRI